MSRIYADVKLKVFGACRKFISYLREQFLKITACSIIRDTQRVTQRPEYSTKLLIRRISLRRKFRQCLDIFCRIVFGACKKTYGFVYGVKFVVVTAVFYWH